jgi:hypothetical protein
MSPTNGPIGISLLGGVSDDRQLGVTASSISEDLGSNAFYRNFLTP